MTAIATAMATRVQRSWLLPVSSPRGVQPVDHGQAQSVQGDHQGKYYRIGIFCADPQHEVECQGGRRQQARLEPEVGVEGFLPVHADEGLLAPIPTVRARTRRSSSTFRRGLGTVSMGVIGHLADRRRGGGRVCDPAGGGGAWCWARPWHWRRPWRRGRRCGGGGWGARRRSRVGGAVAGVVGEGDASGTRRRGGGTGALEVLDDPLCVVEVARGTVWRTRCCENWARSVHLDSVTASRVGSWMGPSRCDTPL